MIFKPIAPYITDIIFALAIITFVVWLGVRWEVKKLNDIVFPPGDRRFGDSYTKITADELKNLSRIYKGAALTYTIFANFSAIFPLLGIFGTVCSLVGLSGTDVIADNFSIALDTTAWGLVFAMIFKVLDSFVSSPLDVALDGADYLFHEDDREKRSKYAAQAETGHRY